MHCKFLVCLLVVSFFFSFFSSACEFLFIERIGAHGKQNPDFVITVLLLLHVWMTVFWGLFITFFSRN